MAKSVFKMKGSPMQRNFGIGSPMKDVESNNLLESVEVSGGKKTNFHDRNRVMTKEELRDAKINPQEGTTYYKNRKSGVMSTSTATKK